MKKPLLKNESVVQTTQAFEGLPNGSERRAKSELAFQINSELKRRGLTQQSASDLLKITQPEVSNLNKGKLSGFTFDRLLRCLTQLEMDVEIKLGHHSAKNNEPAGIKVYSI